MLRVVGANVLMRPIDQAHGTDLIHLTDRARPTIGQVLSIGTARCADCAAVIAAPFAVGDVVMIPATAGQEITVNGTAYWVVPIDAVLSYWSAEPEKELTHA